MEEPQVNENRKLTTMERQLVRWMLEHGSPRAKGFLPQLEVAMATSWRCPCGCASVNFVIDGHKQPPGGMDVIADFIFGNEAELSGIFVYVHDGVLSGLEVYGLAGDAPKQLPSPELLRPIQHQPSGPALRP